MNYQTVKAMVQEAYDSGVAIINYAGINSGGLASSSDNSITVFLNRYPDMAGDKEPQSRYTEMVASLKAGNKKFNIKKFFDSLDVKDGYLKVTINHLMRQDESNGALIKTNGDLVAGDEYSSRYTKDYVSAIKYGYSHCNYSTQNGERLHTVLIPFENLLYITVK